MAKYLVYMILLLTIVQQSHSQEGAAVVLALPVRNSLKFNRYVMNPTFSFVREQNKYITFTNKREWMQFDNAPQTYLFSYSGRFSENSGIGVGLFQQNYGVLTTFGGVLNYAYNVVLDRDSNLTFGMNVGAYQSGINDGAVITNYPDPSLENIPSNTVVTINPGINYGTTFLDFGVSLNNLVSYNVTSSELIEENPEQSIQGHVMYTGYINSRGFFDETKFSGLLRSEFKNEITVLSGLMMLTIPKGFWAQAGYNTLYGVSGGLGFNISNQIALEYNYEKAMGDLLTFGSSHEITLAYKFKNRDRYNYSGDDEEGALIVPVKKSRPIATKRTPTSRTVRNTNAQTQAKADEAARIKLEQEQAQAKAREDARIKLEQEQAQAKARADEAARLKLEQDQARIQLEQEQAQAKAREDARIKLEQEQAQAKARADEAARIQLEQEQARIQLEQEQAQAKAREEARIKLEQEQAQEKARAEEAARIAQAQAEVAAREEAEPQEPAVSQVDLDDLIIEASGDNKAKAMQDLTKLTVESNIERDDLLIRLRETVAGKAQDLKDLKEENDLSEQGIVSEPKPFKSVSAENAALESLKLEIDAIITSQNEKIKQLEGLYNERLKTVPNKNEAVNVNYLKAIQTLKLEQQEAIRSKENLLATLEDIKVATEIERKRRIKRAVYDNEEDRYLKDRAALQVIKQNTNPITEPLKEADFDFGEEQSKNIQIIKGVSHVESGYYAVLAVHSDVAKRDEFITQVVASGQSNVDFFYDVNTSKYYIYYQKFETIEAANNALKTSNNEPYNSKMSMVKIEN